MITQIKTNDQTVSTNNSSFVVFYARNITPWKNNESLSSEMRAFTTSGFLMASRWDGRFGFFGGFVDGNETNEEGAVREVKEELGLEISINDLEPICSHNFPMGRDKTLSSHLFAVEVSSQTLKDYQKLLMESRDFGDEIMGSTVILTESLSNGRKGLSQSLKLPMASSVLEEIIELISVKELASKESLELSIEKANLKL